MPDETLIATLVDRYGGALRAFAASRCDVPDDIVQEAYCRLVACRKTPDKPVAWLFMVVRNLVRQHQRTTARRLRRERHVAETDRTMADPGDSVDASLGVQILQTLPAKLRDVVILRIWGGLTLEETADTLETSAASVHRRYAEALGEIRKRMKQACPSTTIEPKTTTVQ